MKKVAIIVAAGLIVVVAAVLVFRHGGSKSGTSNSTNQPTSNSNTCPTPPANTISYCNSAFNTLTVASGTSVTFKNDSNSEVQIDSDPHPVHTDDTELNIGLLQPGQSKTVTLTKTGAFGIHNHLMPSERGSITIQ